MLWRGHGLGWRRFLPRWRLVYLLSDGFALRTAEPLKKMSVARLQHVLAEHSPHASLGIGGEICTPLDGLEFFIHPRAALAAWRDKSRDDCRAYLLSLGFRDR